MSVYRTKFNDVEDAKDSETVETLREITRRALHRNKKAKERAKKRLEKAVKAEYKRTIKECKRAAKRYGDTSTKIKFSSTDVREGVSALLKKEGMSAELITSYGSKYELIVDWSRRLK